MQANPRKNFIFSINFEFFLGLLIIFVMKKLILLERALRNLAKKRKLSKKKSRKSFILFCKALQK